MSCVRRTPSWAPPSWSSARRENFKVQSLARLMQTKMATEEPACSARVGQPMNKAWEISAPVKGLITTHEPMASPSRCCKKRPEERALLSSPTAQLQASDFVPKILSKYGIINRSICERLLPGSKLLFQKVTPDTNTRAPTAGHDQQFGGPRRGGLLPGLPSCRPRSHRHRQRLGPIALPSLSPKQLPPPA